MSKKFTASDWFLKESIGASYTEQAAIAMSFEGHLQSKLACSSEKREIPEETSGINLGKCFIPGWNGESLISKSINRFNKAMDALHQDARSSFLKNQNLPFSLRRSIYEDFINFSEFKACLCHELNETNFWQELRDPKSAYRDVLDQYLDIFTLRASVVYFFKLRFISLLSKSYYENFDLKYAFNPNAFFTSIFQKGGNKELNTKAFSPNNFSWYRPSESITEYLSELTKVINQLNITEITKHISQRAERIIDNDTGYSHSLSHKNFGLFLNALLLNMPSWQNKVQKNNPKTTKKLYAGMEVLSCKFVGDYLESLSQSHWLAQENNRYLKWDEILCSDFKSSDFTTGQYMKLLNELQFLTSLSELALSRGVDPALFTSEVVKGHFINRKNHFFSHDSLPILGMDLGSSTYDRIVLNLAHYPKNNSQHFLINKIQEQTKFMKSSGHLFVLSAKKLFVSSQKTKIDQLLTNLKLESMITLDELKGKGEIGPYLYVFSKRTNPLKTNREDTKETFFSFRFSGELDTFHQFSTFTEHLEKFFKNHETFAPPMYQKELDKTRRFEFFQDAVFEGRLIRSHSKDSSQITHPHFFRSLLSSCKTFDYYFAVSQINNEQQEEGLNLFDQLNYSSTPKQVIIVDKRNDNTTRLEFINYQSLEAKVYEYGVANCSYFGIYPKVLGVSLNSIKDFFDSKIGRQIVDLSFDHNNKKIKATLEKLLVPMYFETTKPLPASIKVGLELLTLSSDKLLAIHPQEMKKKFEDINLLIHGIVKNYPADTLSLISNFKTTLEDCLFYINQGKSNQVINFNNPMIHQPLVMAPTYSLYPGNDDVYTHFESANMNMLHAPLTMIKRKSVKTEDYDGVVLELHSGNTKVITMHSDENMILFLEFILQNASGHPISALLQGLKVPRLGDLNNIINSIKHIGQAIKEVHAKTIETQEKLINSVLLSQPL